MSCKRVGLVIFYQFQFKTLLAESIDKNAEVLAWIPVEKLEENADFYANEIYENLSKETHEKIVSCIMVSSRPLKEVVFRFLTALNINGNHILDVYKTYLSKFPRMRYQRIMERRKGESLDGLVLGISHGLTGIIEDKLPGNVCNLCESSQDLYFNARVLEGLLESYHDEISKLKYVIIDMFDYNYFNFDTIQTGAADIFLEESGFQYEEREPWNKRSSLDELNAMLKKMWEEGNSEEERTLLKEVFPYMEEADDSVYKGYTVLRARTKCLNKEEIEKYQNNPRFTAIQANVFKHTVDFQISNLEHLIQRLKELNPAIQIYFVLLPKYYVVEECEKAVNKIWKQHFYQVMQKVQGKYTNVVFWDFKENMDFSTKPEYYFDLTHFNYWGACEFTDYLAEKLKSATQDSGGNTMDWKEQAVNQLLDAIDIGFMNEENIKKFSCSHLVALLEMSKSLEGGQGLFLKIKTYLENLNIRRLQKQEKIVVGFIANYSSTWIGDELYSLFEQSERFVPYIFLLSNYNVKDTDLRIKEYKENYAFFKERELRVVQTIDFDTEKQYSWDELGVRPDICIWLTPWIDLFEEHFYLLNYSLGTLHTYIPYGFMLLENEKRQFIHHQYNQIIHNIAWKLFEESNFAVKMAEKYAFIGKHNAVYTGYPKLDDFYQKQAHACDIWKQLEKESGNTSAKRIIFAPHHSIIEEGTIKFSTFEYNYKFMLELAKKYEKETIWVFKPHPQLKYKAVAGGIFKSLKEWDEYVNSWKQLSNADYYDEGAYCSLLRESDAMILDCGSFLAEYLYTGNPGLFLTRKEQFFNDFGEAVKNTYYLASGDDFEAIEHFLVHTVLEGNDVKKDERKSFYKEHLDYVSEIGDFASENIYKEIERALNNE